MSLDIVSGIVFVLLGIGMLIGYKLDKVPYTLRGLIAFLLVFGGYSLVRGVLAVT